MEFYLGTWQVAPSDGFWTGQDLVQSEKTISEAVNLGICSFDTAQSYGKGQAEQTLSKVLRRYSEDPLRFRIDTKIMPSTKDVSSILQTSLLRLKPFGVDCLYLHWPRTGFDNKRFLSEMARLREKNLVGKIGVCNIPLEMLQSFIREGIAIDRIQIPISLLWTRDLDSTLLFCSENRISVAAYSPTGMGLLSGKYHSAQDLTDARKGLFCFQDRCHRHYLDLLETISAIAKNNGSTCTKVALSWVVSKNPDIIIVGARNKDQLRENLSGSISLSESELSDLENAAHKLEMASRGICTNIFSYNW